MVRFRLKPDEHAVLEGKAAQAGLTLSDFCRIAATSKPVFARNDNVPMELVGAMRSAGHALLEALNEGRKGGFSPAAMARLEQAATAMEAAFRSVFHAP